MIKFTHFMRKLSFFVPSVILFVLYVYLIFFNEDKPLFWIVILLLCGIGTLYNGFFQFLNFIILVQVSLFVLFKIFPYFTQLKFTHDDIYYWTITSLTSFFLILITRISVIRAKTASYARDIIATLLINTPNSVVIIDPMLQIIEMSDSFTKMFRIQAPRLIKGKLLIDLLPENSKLLIKELIKSNSYYETIKELNIYNNIGYYKIMCDKLHGSTNGYFINIIDITPIMKAKIDVERSAKAKDLFLAKMSHEIRTPLNAITGMSELVLRTDISPRVREYVSGIQNAGTNLISIINDILDFSKIESGNMEIIERIYNTESLINDVINIIQVPVIDKPILFITNIDSSLPSALKGDVVRIRQILINILNNAVKYTNEGFISFNFTYNKKNEETINLNITVSDSGRGIKKEDFSKIFGEFIQIDLQQNIGIEGTGLGLAIVKSLCKAMGAEISLESEYGKGSDFNIIIPQKIENINRIAYVHKPEKKKVIIYDNRELYAKSISTSLDNLGVSNEIISSLIMLNEKLSELENCTRNENAIQKDEYCLFIFVISIFYEDVIKFIKKNNIKANVVMLTEANTIIECHIRSIPMPAHTISIAKVLNNMEDSFIKDNKKSRIDWTAPNANVLIVDDINTNIIVAEGLMSPYKMNITSTLNGKDAVELVSKYNYDIIFMDHMMPEMDGIEAAAKIRMIPSKHTIPIIALTANAIHGVEEMFKYNGFNDLLVKPIDITKLDIILEKWIPPQKRIIIDNNFSKATKIVAQKTILANAVNSIIKPDVLSIVKNITDTVMNNNKYCKDIEGIDTKKGLENSGNNEELYSKMLSGYFNEGITYIDKLKYAVELNDIKQFTIYVHGIKTSSLNIGAFSVSESAKYLEDAGNAGDWDFIKNEFGTFLNLFSKLLDNIKENIYNEKIIKQTNNDNYTNIDYNFLKEHLLIFNASVSNLDISTMDNILQILNNNNWDKDITYLIEKLQSFVLIGEYDDAVKVSFQIIEKIGL
jgi:signal transduction histidine kinase/CheY-like chemotaxis protein